MESIKVGAKTKPASAAGAIAGILEKEGKVEIVAIGAGAVNQTVKSIAVARGYVGPIGKNLICVPAFGHIMEEDNEKTCIKFTVGTKETI